MWYPNKKGRIKSSFKIKRKASPKRFNYDLHNVTGFYFFIPLFLAGFTGAAFYFIDETKWFFNAITFSEQAEESIWEVKNNQNLETDIKFLSIEDALTEMDKYYPDMYKRNMWMTGEKNGTLSFAYQDKVDIHAGPDTRIFLRADPYSGEILSEYNPKDMPLGSKIIADWHLPIHFGEFGGIFTRIQDRCKTSLKLVLFFQIKFFVLKFT